MRLRTVLLGALVTGLLVQPTPAAAGGWWNGIDLDGRYLGIGESLTVRSEVMFRTLPVAEKARRIEYRAYLVRGVDTQALERAMSRPEPRRWWTPPAEMTLVGRVELSRWDSNLVTATARLTIPDMPPGRYDLMLCDIGCRTPLGNLIPLGVDVSADALAAKTARRLERTNEKFELALARARYDLRRNNRSATEASAEAADAVARLRQRISSLETAAPSTPSPPPTPWVPYAAWFMTGAVVALLVLRLRRRSPSPIPEILIERVPDDARELTSRR